jgi:hypothetical protein
MRVNIYAEEMTDKVELIEKEAADGKFVGVRFWLELPVTRHDLGPIGASKPTPVQISGPFMHHPGDNDSAAVTFWGKAQLKIVLRKALTLLGERALDSNQVRDLQTIAGNLRDTHDDDIVAGEIRGYGKAIQELLKP